MVHILVALFLVVVILLQGGRGGLGETMGGAAAQSLFGGGANTVMTKLTAVVAGFFMVTCLSLAMLSTKQGRSVIEQLPAGTSELPLPPLSTQPAESSTPTVARPALSEAPPASHEAPPATNEAPQAPPPPADSAP
ncbi:MAG: preprotein translocase subunit SecG [Candidatus Omnitrophica bacterium]|nr:preprotein translocase subunit SecG [Candidatus Omnitrophota bacterium]